MTFSFQLFLPEWLLTYPIFLLLFYNGRHEINSSQVQIEACYFPFFKYDFLFVIFIPWAFYFYLFFIVNDGCWNQSTNFNTIPNIVALYLKICSHTDFPKTIVFSDKARTLVVTTTLSKNWVCGTHPLDLWSKLHITYYGTKCKFGVQSKREVN